MLAVDEDHYDSSDDEDYVPPAVVDEQDEKDDLEYDDIQDDLVNKKIKKSNNAETKPENIVKNTEEEKKRIDSLWDDFLADTHPATSFIPSSKVNTSSTNSKEPDNKIKVNIENLAKNDSLKVQKEIFIFAGEEVEINQSLPSSSNTFKQDLKKEANDKETNQRTKRKWTPNVKSGSVLANAAKLLSKRKKISVLDKTDHDWKEFVAKEGIADDLKNHGRSKDAFLDKQDFLLKADYMQFEKEKALRQAERSKQQK